MPAFCSATLDEIRVSIFKDDTALKLKVDVNDINIQDLSVDNTNHHLNISDYGLMQTLLKTKEVMTIEVELKSRQSLR